MSLLRQILFGAGLLAALAGWYLWSQHELHVAQASARTASAQASTLKAELTAARKNVRIVTHYVDRVHTVHARGRTLIKEVPVYVPTTAAHRCVVNRGFVRLFNAAAQGIDLPASAASADAPAPGIGLPDIARASVHNDTTYHALAQQLTSLQAWVRAHSLPAAATSTGPP